MEYTDRNRDLWEMAQRRAGFKKHLFIYLTINPLLWVFWWFVNFMSSKTPEMDLGFPWPLFPLLGWGIGLFMHYFFVYKWNDNLTKKEYEKLIKKTDK